MWSAPKGWGAALGGRGLRHAFGAAPVGRWRDLPGALQSAGTFELGPGAPLRIRTPRGYLVAHSQKFHQTPVWFGMYFTPVTLSL